MHRKIMPYNIYLLENTKLGVKNDDEKKIRTDHVKRMISRHELFHDLESHLIGDCKPSEYLSSINSILAGSKFPMNLLYRLQFTEQSPRHHPEGSVWNHTLLVVDQAAAVKDKSSHPRAFMWAALLHDIGKPQTTRIRKGKITSYNHDKVGARLAGQFLSAFSQDEGFIKRVVSLVGYHMHILFLVNDLPFADLAGLREHTDIQEVALLGLCDRLGRTGANIKREQENVRLFIQKAHHLYSDSE